MSAVGAMDGNTGESPSKMSKEAEALRSFVSERLAAASREILSVVDRVVAGYEEEASGLRQEIHGQRLRLEELQPQSRVRSSGVKRSRSRGEEEEEEEEEESHQICESQSRIDLRIRILEDPQTTVLSKTVLKKCPLLKLRCPRGLPESDFLDLIKSSFPRLTAEKTFDLLMVKRQRLQPLNLKTLTAEDVHRAVSRTASAKSTVYIRLKNQEEPQTRRDEGPVLQTQTSSDRRHMSSPAQEVEDSSQQGEDMDREEAGDEEAAPELHSAAEPEGGRSHGQEKEEGRDQTQRPDEGGLKKTVSRLQSKRQRVTCSGSIQAKTEDTVTAVSCKVCPHKPGDASGVHDGADQQDGPGSGLGAESVEDLQHKPDDCPVCGESFCSVLSLSEDVAVHTGETPYKRAVCPSKASPDKHQELHEGAPPHKCCTCHEEFENKEQLKAHSRTHTSRKTHLCGVCGKSLSDFRSLTRHKMTHSGERPHSCQICGRRFKLPGTLRQHEKIHTDRERSYLCEICCKMFLTSQQLQIHLRRHSDDKPYLCGECGKGFTTKGPLTVHMRVHTGETPYRCPDCGWSFKRKTNLDNHIAVHSGVKPFVCGICGKACARKTHLTVHMRTHNGERPYKCSLCDKAFTQSHCLKTHMKSHQGGQPPS